MGDSVSNICSLGGTYSSFTTQLTGKCWFVRKTYNRLADRKGRVIIASRNSDEVSWELPEMRNGLFSHYLLQGMRSQVAKPNGTVWVFDLFSYVSEHVPKHKPEQNPFMKSKAENFIVAITK